MDFRLYGKVALVTGASRGIGRLLAEELAMAGADVILVARSKDEIEQGAQEIAQITVRRTLALSCDVTDKGSIDDMVNQAINELDILIF